MPFPDLPSALARALAGRGYNEPTEVQSAVLAAGAARDLLVSAQTGSGKTVAFGLAIAPTLLGQAEHLATPSTPLALIIAPTRELALQVAAELTWLFEPSGGRIVACVGGMDPRRERQLLGAGCHIVVGTPGRLRDHLERSQLDPTGLRAVVLDEADEMLDLGFREDLEFILAATPSERRTMMFSATIPRGIAALAQTFQRDALRLDTARRDRPHADIDYQAFRIAPGEAERATVNILRAKASPGALVFCATREAVRHMHASLQERGFAAVALSGEMSQHERNRAMSALRDGRAQLCIATDVAARGLDLPSLDLVIHADLPGSRETLLHRSGRTGRAGRKGVCAVLVPADRQRRAMALFSAAGVTASWVAVPSPEEIRARDDQRLLADPSLAEPPTAEELDLAQRVLNSRAADATVAVLLRLIRARLPAPEEITPAAEPRSAGERKPRSTRHDFTTDAARFRVSLGRRHKADPKWLLPLICRVGGVKRQEIGRIDVGDQDTVFEVTAAAAARFRASAGQPNAENVQITELASTGLPASRPAYKVKHRSKPPNRS